MKNQETLKLINQPLPEPHLNKFSFISTNKADIEQWLSNLSLQNMAEISKQVRTTLVEIAHFQADASAKFDIIETIRPTVYNLINSLSKHYLNQSLVLDNKAISVANLVQQLRGYDFAIYKQLAVNLLRASPAKKGGLGGLFGKLDAKPATAIHRAITALTGLVYETDLLYLPAFDGNWRNLHELYALAEQQKLLETKVKDLTLTKNSDQISIRDAYMRAVLLSICRTNSLRQQEIQKLFTFTELWSKLLVENASPSPNDLFVIDLASDSEPSYITTNKKLSSNLRYINATGLLEHIRHIKNKDIAKIDNSEVQLTQSNLIDYVLQSIEEPLERTSSRHPFEGELQCCLGMIACHYHIAGGFQFQDVIKYKEFIKQQSADNLLMDTNAGFDDDLSMNSHDTMTAGREFLRLTKVKILDISPGGYRVSWEGESPRFLKTGELISLREDQSKPWQLGVIRWVQQKPMQGADFGVEILASKATACGVQPVNHDEGTLDFMRAVILPEVKSLNRAATVVTTNYQFKEGQRIVIRRGNADIVAKLGKQHLKTQSFHQYDFTIIPNIKKI